MKLSWSRQTRRIPMPVAAVLTGILWRPTWAWVALPRQLPKSRDNRNLPDGLRNLSGRRDLLPKQQRLTMMLTRTKKCWMKCSSLVTRRNSTGQKIPHSKTQRTPWTSKTSPMRTPRTLSNSKSKISTNLAKPKSRVQTATAVVKAAAVKKVDV